MLQVFTKSISGRHWSLRSHKGKIISLATYLPTLLIAGPQSKTSKIVIFGSIEDRELHNSKARSWLQNYGACDGTSGNKTLHI